MPAFSLRASCAADADLLYLTTEAYFRPLVEAHGRKWAVARMQEKCASDARGGLTSVIEVGDVRAGFLTVERRPNEIWLETLVLVENYRGQGIGGQVVADLNRQADACRIRTRLGIIKGNRAHSFWKRYGFKVVGDFDALHLLMERAT